MEGLKSLRFLLRRLGERNDVSDRSSHGTHRSAPGWCACHPSDPAQTRPDHSSALVATSGGLDTTGLGAVDWRQSFRRASPVCPIGSPLTRTLNPSLPLIDAHLQNRLTGSLTCRDKEITSENCTCTSPSSALLARKSYGKEDGPALRQPLAGNDSPNRSARNSSPSLVVQAG
jgi:hypothetical protein